MIGKKKLYRDNNKENVFALISPDEDNSGVSSFDKIQTAEVLAAARRYDTCKNDKYNTGAEESDYLNTMFRIHEVH